MQRKKFWVIGVCLILFVLILLIGIFLIINRKYSADNIEYYIVNNEIIYVNTNPEKNNEKYTLCLKSKNNVEFLNPIFECKSIGFHILKEWKEKNCYYVKFYISTETRINFEFSSSNFETLKGFLIPGENNFGASGDEIAENMDYQISLLQEDSNISFENNIFNINFEEVLEETGNFFVEFQIYINFLICGEIKALSLKIENKNEDSVVMDLLTNNVASIAILGKGDFEIKLVNMIYNYSETIKIHAF